MSNQYNFIGKNYVNKFSPTKEYTRIPTILKMSGSIEGKDVLDLACGDGYQTRKLTEFHPRSLTGIDISPVMIGMAKREEQINPLGITYHVGDVLNLDYREQFDVVTAIYLLDYAKTVNDLRGMCKSIYQALKHGGILSTITISPSIIPRDEYRFGWKTVHPQGKNNLSDGDEINIISDPENGPQVIIACYYWTEQTYETCLLQAGFQQLEWCTSLEISEEGRTKYTSEYWKQVLDSSGGTGIKAVKI